MPSCFVVSNFLNILSLRLHALVLLLRVEALGLRWVVAVEVLVIGTLLILHRLEVNCIGKKSNLAQ